MRLEGKLLFYILLLSLMGLGAVAQVDISSTRSRFGLGVNGGVTIGDYSNVYSTNLGVDIIYLYSVSSRFHIGATTGFANYFYENGSSDPNLRGDLEDVQFLPITASIRLSPLRNLLAGGDIGYAVGLDDGNDGGFYASPRLTYLFAGRVPIFLGYRTINLDNNLASVQFGIGLIIK